MLIIGLTGSIGMGKSTAAARFREHGITVCDADAIVHELYAGGYGGVAVKAIEGAFPGTTIAGSDGRKSIDRQKLSQSLMADDTGFKTLEAIVHPLVRAAEQACLQVAYEQGAALAVLEIPLLFETGGDELVDAIVTVSAPSHIQRTRVLERPGMTPEKYAAIVARQLPDEQKRARSHFVVDTSTSIEESAAEIDKIIAELKTRSGTAYSEHWS